MRQNLRATFASFIDSALSASPNHVAVKILGTPLAICRANQRQQ
jgi:hypothetical protein